jgi:hypothetical protein
MFSGIPFVVKVVSHSSTYLQSLPALLHNTPFELRRNIAMAASLTAKFDAYNTSADK